MKNDITNLISKTVLGTVQFGLSYGVTNTQGAVAATEVARILNLAEQNKINKLDTSCAYGNSEEVLGKYAKASFAIISKFHSNSANVQEVFQHSLAQLKRTKIYGYLVHDFTFFRQHADIWLQFEQLKQASLVEKIGFSLYSVDELEWLFEQNIQFDLIQFPYNMFDRSFAAYLPRLKELNVELHVRSVFLQGLFFMPLNLLPAQLLPLKPYLQSIHDYCADSGLSMEELALNFVFHNKLLDGVLIGVETATQLEKNIAAIKHDIPEQMLDFIDSIAVAEQNLLQPKNWN